MTLFVFCAVLAAALLHAVWNALIKIGANKQQSMALLVVSQASVGGLVAAFRDLPPAAAWGWLLASGVVHMAYQMFLAYAYEQGDLSRVYPIARGAAPLIVLLVSIAALPDAIAAMEYVGVVVLGLGIALMARGVFRNGESRRLLPFALGSACATAAYTVIDGLGARISGDPLAFTGWLMVMSAVFYLPAVTWLRGPGVLRAPARVWGIVWIAGAASFVAFAIAVWAMTVAPIALVAALRETSILFAVLIGWLVFGERMDRGKALASVLILTGVILTRL